MMRGVLALVEDGDGDVVIMTGIKFEILIDR